MNPRSFDHREPLCRGSLSVDRFTAVSHQTVKLTKGKHSSPEQGACAMELASMLAGEPFSDDPLSVCPVIGSFLRAYNDSIDDDRRQDLYEYASKVVGSRASEAVERARAKRLIAWAVERRRPLWARLLARAARRWLGLENRQPFLGPPVVRAIGRHTDETHAQALALIDELLALDTARPAPSTMVADGRQSAQGVAQAVARDAHVAAQSDDERTGIALLRERHNVT